MVRGFCLVDYKYYIGNNFCINVRLLLLEVTRTDLEEGKRNRDKCVFVLDQKRETRDSTEDRTGLLDYIFRVSDR